MTDHSSEDILHARLCLARNEIQVGSTYYHYKNPNKLYRVVNVILREEDEQIAIVYRTDDGYRLPWVRSYSSWISEPEPGVQRFTLKC